MIKIRKFKFFKKKRWECMYTIYKPYFFCSFSLIINAEYFHKILILKEEKRKGREREELATVFFNTNIYSIKEEERRVMVVHVNNKPVLILSI
jgi:hypothetical protein